jgi:hypothetical protein
MWYDDEARKGRMAARRLRKYCISLMADLDVQKAAYRLLPGGHIDTVRLSRTTSKKRGPWFATVTLKQGSMEVTVRGEAYTRKEAVLVALSKPTGQLTLPMTASDDLPF